MPNDVSLLRVNMMQWVCLRLVILWLMLVDESSGKCPQGYYYAINVRRCRRCSRSCPEEYIFMSCTEFEDVLCYRPPLSREIHPNGEEGGSNELHNHSPPGTVIQVDMVRAQTNPDVSGDDDLDSDREMELTMEEKHDWQHWKTLAFALIALLCLLIMVATVVVVIACLKLQQALVSKNNEEPDIDDADSGYVVIRTIRDVSPSQTAQSGHSLYAAEERLAHPPLLTSLDTGLGSSESPSSFSSPPQSLCFLPKAYIPQRRLLTYDADEVFESDDQAQLSTDCARELHLLHQATPRSENLQYRPPVANAASCLHGQNVNTSRKKRKTWKPPVNGMKDSRLGCFGRKRNNQLDHMGENE